MAGYGDDNKDYSDSQRKFNEGKMTDFGDGIVDIVRSSNPEVTASKGVYFCLECGAMMLPKYGKWECNCGYSTDDSEREYNLSVDNPPVDNPQIDNKPPIHTGSTKVQFPYSSAKSKTFIDLTVKNSNLKINQQLSISGHLNLKNDYVLVNAEIEIYFAGKFIESIYTDDNGYFESNFLVDAAGKQEVEAFYSGSSNYESSIAKDYVNVTGREVIGSNDDDIISQLEKLGALYERGLLTDEEFEEMKRKLIAKY